MIKLDIAVPGLGIIHNESHHLSNLKGTRYTAYTAVGAVAHGA